MIGRKMGVGVGFTVAAIVFVTLVAFSVATMPSGPSFPVPTGTVLAKGFGFTVGPAWGQLVGAWKSDTR